VTAINDQSNIIGFCSKKLEKGDRDLELKEGYVIMRDSSRVFSKFIKDIAMIEKKKIVQSGQKKRIPARGQNANITFQH
jgi:hypothetical protein